VRAIAGSPSAAWAAAPHRRALGGDPRAGALQIIAAPRSSRTGARLAFATALRDAVGRERVIAAVDSKGGHVVIHWLEDHAALDPAEAVRALEPYCDEFLYTHVARKG